MSKFGFIGTGKMGSAVLAAVVGVVAPEEITVANRTVEKARRVSEQYGCRLSTNKEIAQEAYYIVLGVKPQFFPDVAEEIRDILAARKDRFVIISMMAALSIEKIREAIGGDYPVIRIMPNIPMAIGKGMISYAADGVTDEEKELFVSALAGAGRLAALPEKLIDAGSGVAGCSPAYVAMFIEALADGGVACGLPRATAQEMAAQAVLGSAAYILECCKTPEELKDAVCSPGGTTIQGVRELEYDAFRGAVIEAVIQSVEANAKFK